MEAERFRRKAQVYMRLRCCLLTHVKIGKPPAEVPSELAVAIAEELLLQANSAAQKAELIMATAVSEGGNAPRRRPRGRNVPERVKT
jgi:hypothetical protein